MQCMILMTSKQKKREIVYSPPNLLHTVPCVRVKLKERSKEKEKLNMKTKYVQGWSVTYLELPSEKEDPSHLQG